MIAYPKAKAGGRTRERPSDNIITAWRAEGLKTTPEISFLFHHPRIRHVEEWADQMRIARRTLHRHLELDTGIGPQRWLQLARALRVAEHLAEGRSVRDACRAAGEPCQFAFSNMLHLATGLRPSDIAGRDMPADVNPVIDTIRYVLRVWRTRNPRA